MLLYKCPLIYFEMKLNVSLHRLLLQFVFNEFNRNVLLIRVLLVLINYQMNLT